MDRLIVGSERLRSARPDSISRIDQLTAGQVVIGFDAYRDFHGVVNAHLSHLAVVTGSAARIIDGEIIDRGIGFGKSVKIEPLDSYTIKHRIYGDPTWLRVNDKGIEGVDKSDAPTGLSAGLLAVRQEPYQTGPSLEVSPGLYINGANDFYTIFKDGFMAVALDSDSRLMGML
ncbi:MAG TPA: hypothetical protein VF733_06060 [Candidatus Saccharimonadales bacterium]